MDANLKIEEFDRDLAFEYFNIICQTSTKKAEKLLLLQKYFKSNDLFYILSILENNFDKSNF